MLFAVPFNNGVWPIWFIGDANEKTVALFDYRAKLTFNIQITERKPLDSFSDYKADAASWITLATGEYYPDILPYACELYKPVLVLFGQLTKSSESSEALFRQISEVNEGWMRVQLARVFRKYASPETPVEMLKKKAMVDEICKNFGKKFRPINQV